MSHWELKPKGTQTWVECLYEWKDKVGADLQWECSVAQSSTHTWRATAKINGQAMRGCIGEGGSKDDAKNAAAILLNRNRLLYRRN